VGKRGERVRRTHWRGKGRGEKEEEGSKEEGRKEEGRKEERKKGKGKNRGRYISRERE
jgi:hypothetical protein